MIYGDNPNKINEREDALGLKTYTYSPSINSIMQSGNVYVYGLNNPIVFLDYFGESVILTVCSAFALGIISQMAGDVASYFINGCEGKVLNSSMTEYAMSGISGVITAFTGVGGALFSSILSEYVISFEKSLKGENIYVDQFWMNVFSDFTGGLVCDAVSSAVIHKIKFKNGGLDYTFGGANTQSNTISSIKGTSNLHYNGIPFSYNNDPLSSENTLSALVNSAGTSLIDYSTNKNSTNSIHIKRGVFSQNQMALFM